MDRFSSHQQEQAARALAAEIGGHVRSQGNGNFCHALVVCAGPRHAEGRTVRNDSGWFGAHVAHLAVATFPHRAEMI